jgi:hypothetical protein
MQGGNCCGTIEAPPCRLAVGKIPTGRHGEIIINDFKGTQSEVPKWIQTRRKNSVLVVFNVLSKYLLKVSDEIMK